MTVPLKIFSSYTCSISVEVTNCNVMSIFVSTEVVLMIVMIERHKKRKFLRKFLLCVQAQHFC